MLPLRCLFAFHGAAGSLLEIKRLDQPAGSPPEQVYYWLWKPAASHSWQRLDFAAMQTEPVQYRRFAQGELWFDASHARLQLAGAEHTLPAGEPDSWQASVSAWLVAPQQTILKPASNNDSEQVTRLLQQSADWLQQRGDTMWLPEEVSPQAIANALAAGEYHLLYLGAEAVGTCRMVHHDPLFWPELPHAHSLFLHRIALSRRHKGQGLLACLLQHAVAEARRHGYRDIRLDCAAERLALRQHYQKHGFQLLDECQAGPWQVARFIYPLVE